MFSLLLTQSVPVPYKSEPLSGEEEQTGSERKHRDDPEIYGREAAVNLRVFSEKMGTCRKKCLFLACSIV